MNKIILTTAILMMSSGLASANPFLPVSQTFQFDVTDSDAAGAASTRTKTIKLSAPENANQFEKMTFCNDLANENNAKLPTLTDRAGSNYLLKISGALENCVLTVPRSMHDSDHRLNLTYKGTTRVYDIQYRDQQDIEFISSNEMINADGDYEFTVGDFMYFHISKLFGNLHIESSTGGLTANYSQKFYSDIDRNSPNSHLTLSGEFTNPRTYHYKITDLNSDNKSIDITINVKAKPAPEPEKEEEVAGCVMPTPPEGQRIVFRYSMKTVGAKC